MNKRFVAYKKRFVRYKPRLRNNYAILQVTLQTFKPLDMTTDFYNGSIEITLSGVSVKKPAQKHVSISDHVVAAFIALQTQGITAVKAQKEIKYIKICNFLAMTSLLASLLYTVLSLLWGNRVWFMAVGSLVVTSAAVLYINHIGRVLLSRVFYITSVNILLFIIALIIGPYAQVQYFLLIAILIPFLVFDLDNYKYIILGVCLPAIFILSYEHTVPFFDSWHLSMPQQSILRGIGLPMEIALSVAALFQFIYYSNKTEYDLVATNRQLTKQSTDLKRSNADLEQFAYVISHDLKTPVRNISCFMQLLSNKHAISLDTEAVEFVDFAIKSSKRMERLIDDLLSYSRIGRNLSNPAPVNVNDVINTINYELNGNNIISNSKIIIDHELPTIANTHSSLIYHVFQNLIKNGLKFNKSSNPEINIAWAEDDEYYTFSVKDNGIGLSQKYATQVFQMFKRLHAEHEYEGTGIGLAICKRIVEHYHGKIWYESEEGKGATFFFTIKKF